MLKKLLLGLSFLLVVQNNIKAAAAAVEPVVRAEGDAPFNVHMDSFSPADFEATKRKGSLHWTQRPATLKAAIDKSFKDLLRGTQSSWGLTNGRSVYGLFRMHEHKVIKQLILDKYKTGQKEFFVMEVGAGNFQWNAAISEYLNSQKDLPKGIRIHIIGISAEGTVEAMNTKREEGICTQYNLGRFQAEELEANFIKRGFNLFKRVDFIISSYTMRHLIDPVGTFAQIYNLLSPDGGIFICDGFAKDPYTELGYESVNTWLNVLNILLHAEEPFLSQFLKLEYTVYLLKRTKDEPLYLPFEYQHDTSLEGKYKKMSYTGITNPTHQVKITYNGDEKGKFHALLGELHRSKSITEESMFSELLFGNKALELFDWLIDNNLTMHGSAREEFKYKPLLEE